MGNYPEDDQLTSSQLQSGNGSRSAAGVAIASPHASSAIGEGSRFVPGTIIADRYRVIAQIGRGGMGEVYRADDLRLGQAVALKFLPEVLTRDGAALARLTREVRTARQVSHPNVCRVFDIGEADGISFITMEFVDGEDLASLLRRIGRLQEAKALQLAHQLCAGLAEIHAFGILHRDLKPANIMLDGRGNLRITDFGLAVVAQEIPGEETMAGTPAYMAPEQLAGEKPTQQSDIYALGLILFELFTGKPAFESLRTRTSTTLKPSTVAKDVDGVIERAILRCLEKDPAERPRTATIVASALPGGDPLAAAIAAGETPSPDMVAAAVDEPEISVAKAWMLFGALMLAILGCVAAARFASVEAIFPPDKPAEIMADRSQQLLRQLGYTKPAADSTYWTEDDFGQLRYLADNEKSREWVRKLDGVHPSLMRFFYRESPKPLDNLSGDITPADPPHEVPGMAMVEVDQRGRLRLLRVVPPRFEEAPQSVPPVNWDALFAAAELPQASFSPVTSKWQPPMAFDAQASWEGNVGGHVLHVTAASFHGRPVYFEVKGPWSSTVRDFSSDDWFAKMLGLMVVLGLPLLLWIGGFILARNHWRAGRGDRAGAFKLGMLVFTCLSVSSLLTMHHAVTPAEYIKIVVQTGFALHLAGLTGVLYLGIEPMVRRRWPGYLVSWTRALAGRFDNPRVGRDLLVGALLGAANRVLESIGLGLPYWMNIPTAWPEPTARQLGTVSIYTSGIISIFVTGVFAAVAIVGLLTILTMLVRNRRVALVIVALVALALHSSGFLFTLPISAIHTAVILFLLLRFGVLSLACSFVCTWWLEFPLTLDPSRWYFGRSILLIALVTAVGIYGFRAALAGRPMFGADPVEN